MTSQYFDPKYGEFIAKLSILIHLIANFALFKKRLLDSKVKLGCLCNKNIILIVSQRPGLFQDRNVRALLAGVLVLQLLRLEDEESNSAAKDLSRNSLEDVQFASQPSKKNERFLDVKIRKKFVKTCCHMLF